MPLFSDPEIERRLRTYASALGQGELVPGRKIAALLRDVLTETAEHECPRPLPAQPQFVNDHYARLTGAIHMLHEQAHGYHTPFRMCGIEPCSGIGLDLRGPAPLSIPSAVSA